jgi:hypothetical protein
MHPERRTKTKKAALCMGYFWKSRKVKGTMGKKENKKKKGKGRGKASKEYIDMAGS